jgi:hypothetical protein
MDFRSFTADKVIIHEVPRRFVGGPGAQLTLSAQAEDLSGMAKLKPFFERKVRASLDRQGFDVERDPKTNSQVPDLVAEVIGDESKLVAASQTLAQQLYQVQTGVNPAGLLCVALGKIGSETAVAVLKVEREEGARVQARGSGGQRSLTMSYLDDLMITGKTRIFKPRSSR